jgi:hypothetical protein
LEYEFTIIYKHGRKHVVFDVLSIFPYSSRSIGSFILDCGCIIILCRTYMDARSKKLLKDRSDAENFDLNLKIEVGQKDKTFHSEKRNNV